MASKKEFLESILSEMKAIQSRGIEETHSDKSFSFPPTLPAPEGGIILVTQKVIDDVFSYADLLMHNDVKLAHAYTKKDLRTLTRRAFGRALVSIDLDDELEANMDALSDAVEGWMIQAISDARIEQTFTFGSWVFSGDRPIILKVGPVTIEDRRTWLSSAATKGMVSRITDRRVARRWNGRHVRKRKSNIDEAAEAAILAAIGNCPAVTSVDTAHLSGGAAEEKALRVARIAHAAVALLWETPSSVLGRMGLLFDGGMLKRHYVVLTDDGKHGSSSSISRMSGGALLPDNWNEVWLESGWFIKPIGEALASHLMPPGADSPSRILNALFLSLWWFHAACEEQSPLFAIVKFAASMDSLANGTKRKGITQLVESRRGGEPGTPLFVDGRTTYDVIGEMHDTARSRTIHGTLDSVGHDWTETRTRAEAMARLCLRFACGWITDHPGSDDLDALRKPGPATGRECIS